MKPGYVLLLFLMLFLSVGSVFAQQSSVSTIGLEIDLFIPKLEKSLNHSLNGVLYEDHNLKDDGYEIKLTKANQIKLQLKGNVIEYTVPLDIWLKTGFQKDVLGFPIESFYEATGVIELKLSSKVLLSKDWSLNVTTQLVSHRWIKEPQLKVAGFNLPITTIANITLDNSKARLEEEIDKSIRGFVDLRQIANKFWSEVQESTLLDKENQIWLTIMPKEVFLTPLISSSNRMKINIGVKAVLESTVGYKPEATRKTALVDIQSRTNYLSQSQISTFVDIKFSKIEEILRKEMIGKTFSQGKKQVTIKEIRIFGVSNKLQLEVDVEGSIKGKLFIDCIPSLNSQDQTLVFTDFDYTLSTKNLLLKGAEWFLHKHLLAMIQPMLTYSFKEDVDNLLIAFNKSFNSYELYSGFILRGSITECNINSVSVEKESVKISGNINAKLKLETGDI